METIKAFGLEWNLYTGGSPETYVCNYKKHELSVIRCSDKEKWVYSHNKTGKIDFADTILEAMRKAKEWVDEKENNDSLLISGVKWRGKDDEYKAEYMGYELEVDVVHTGINNHCNYFIKEYCKEDKSKHIMRIVGQGCVLNDKYEAMKKAMKWVDEQEITEPIFEKSPDMLKLIKFCEEHNACEEGLEFLKQFDTPEEFYDKCQNTDWLLWLADKLNIATGILGDIVKKKNDLNDAFKNRILQEISNLMDDNEKIKFLKEKNMGQRKYMKYYAEQIEEFEKELQQKEQEIVKINAELEQDRYLAATEIKKLHEKIHELQKSKQIKIVHQAEHMKLKTIEAWMELERRYRENKKNNHCPLCEIHNPNTDDCKGCPMASMNEYEGCIDFATYKSFKGAEKEYLSELEKPTTPATRKANKKKLDKLMKLKEEASIARADFFKKYLPVICSIPAERFTLEGWTYFDELDRND